MLRTLTLAGLLGVAWALGGCNTLAGVGRDVQGVGSSMVWAVDGTAQYIQDVSTEDHRLATAPWPADPYLPGALPPDTRLVFTDKEQNAPQQQRHAEQPYYDVNYEAAFDAHHSLQSY